MTTSSNDRQDFRALRKRYFVDPKVQGAMLLRVLLYFGCCLVSISAMILIWRIVIEGQGQPFWAHMEELWTLYKPVAVASALLIPMLLFDVVRFSHRFVGPMYRLRQCMQRLSRGENVPDVHFRTKDYWKEYAAAFNALRARVLTLEGRAADVTPLDEAVDQKLTDTQRLSLTTPITGRAAVVRERDEELIAV